MKFVYVKEPLDNPDNTVENLLDEHSDLAANLQRHVTLQPGESFNNYLVRSVQGGLDVAGLLLDIKTELLRRFAKLECEKRSLERRVDAAEKALCEKLPAPEQVLAEWLATPSI